MKVKSVASKILTNKWLLITVSLVSLFNIVGYMVMGKFNNILLFIITAILVRYFSKNMLIVLGVSLIFVNLLTLKEGFNNLEGFEKKSHDDTIDKINDEKRKSEHTPIIPHDEMARAKNTTDTSNVESSNVKSDEHFEVGRPKGGSKIDYAATIEGAYDQLNSILGSDGIKNLTGDTQRLMQQQADLAKSMESMVPMIQKIIPLASQASEMMKTMNTDGKGIEGLMEMAKKMSGDMGGDMGTDMETA